MIITPADLILIFNGTAGSPIHQVLKIDNAEGIKRISLLRVYRPDFLCRASLGCKGL